MKFTFKIGNKIKEAWSLYKEHFGSLLALTIISIIISFAENDNWILVIINYIVSILLSYIWIRFTLGILDKKKINLFSKEVLPSLSQFWDFLKTIILSSLCVILGFILFIIPGFYVSGRLLFALYISTEKNQGSVKTIKEAWKMTEGHGWQLFGKSFVIGLFVVLGFIALFVGSFITYPIGMIVIAMMYREFSKLKMNNISTSGKDKETEV